MLVPVRPRLLALVRLTASPWFCRQDRRRFAARHTNRFSSNEHRKIISANVLRLPTAREPTVRAAEGFPPPFPSIHFHRPRWQGAKRHRGKRVLAAGGFPLSVETRQCTRRDADRLAKARARAMRLPVSQLHAGGGGGRRACPDPTTTTASAMTLRSLTIWRTSTPALQRRFVAPTRQACLNRLAEGLLIRARNGCRTDLRNAIRVHHEFQLSKIACGTGSRPGRWLIMGAHIRSQQSCTSIHRAVSVHRALADVDRIFRREYAVFSRRDGCASRCTGACGYKQARGQHGRRCNGRK